MNLELVLRATPAGAGDERAAAWSPRPSTPWPPAASTTTSAAGSPATRSTSAWLVPHFEKMLYDQALLVPLYLHAWQVTGEARYRQVVEETVGYVLARPAPPRGRLLLVRGRRLARARRAASTSGPRRRSTAAVGPELAPAALEWYGVTEAGNFEGRTILTRPVRGDLLRPPEVERPGPCCSRRAPSGSGPASTTRSSPSGTPSCWRPWPRRARPLGRDGLARTPPAPTPSFLLTRLRRPDGRWQRSWQADGGARHDALAADHAALVEAFVALAEATGEARWIDEARAVADTMLDHFWDDDNGGLFTTADDAEALVVRQKDLLDNATPAANSLAATGLLRLGRADRRAALPAPVRADPAAGRRGGRRRPDRLRAPARPRSTCGGPA